MDDRAADQAANLDYQVRFLPGLREFAAAEAAGKPIPDRVQVDPYLWDWVHDAAHRVQHVWWHNRYGARISGHLWLPPTDWVDPVTGRPHLGRWPAVLFVPGLGAFEGAYWGVAETLARAGYVVLSFDPQGQGDSDVAPARRFCTPGRWQRPQEGGIRERGKCAGEPAAPPPPTYTVPDPPPPLPPVGFIVAAHDGQFGPYDVATDYEIFRPNFVFGALDAVTWLLSSADPARRLIDPTRVGIIGHSVGSDGAVVTPGVDPLHRFRAAVALDDYGLPPSTWAPTVPTMLQQSEQEDSLGPYLAKPPADFFPSSQIYRRLTQQDTPAQIVALASSSHGEWSYNPEAIANPYSIGATQSRYGERVGAYYAVAWFDRWLKGTTTRIRGWDQPAETTSADRRLTACRYDQSIDAASIGVGQYDPVTRSNKPYRIDGLTAIRQLSSIVSSPLSLDGRHVADLRSACNG
jgi:dienelactone hydrolase